ncbi:MAG: Fe-S cluster assembly scaffold IscU [Holosporaceae bacterium]|jgi:nitrogen fixation NifU-like protein|nr:Fe-S cluster assembly scaffold IscU [Holosporaceae bacterium]
MKYSRQVADLYENPQNVGGFDENDENVGTSVVGAPSCGDVIKLQIKVDDSGVIYDAKFKTFGCVAAIASSSLITSLVKGKTLEEAQQIKNQEVADYLSLPPVKVHCSILAEEAIKKAIDDYRSKK